MIVLTDQQREAVKKGEVVHVLAPEIGEDVVLLTAKQFESIREDAEEVHAEPARWRLFDNFIAGIATVLEFFPPPERLDVWRLGRDKKGL